MPDKATAAMNVYNAFDGYLKSGGGARWADSNTSAFSIVTWIKKTRGDYG